MRQFRGRRRHMPADSIGWLLCTAVAVLAVIDLLIWASLWNVPNPISKLLVPQAAQSAAAPRDVSSSFFPTVDPQPAGLEAPAAAHRN